jgi:NAD+ kinase
VRRVGFVLKRGKPEAEAIARALIPGLTASGRTVRVLPEQAQLSPEVTVASESELGAGIDLCVCLGGDGTLLHAAALVGDHGVPVLGVNLGTLGFLVPFAPAEARAALERALAGQLELEERIRLTVQLHRADGRVTSRTALNDAVLSQGSMARLVELVATLDGGEVARYKADGLIISTPTGSTAYNLAAGGPILTPTQASLAITPICPHTLTHRPLVVPASSRLAVSLGAGATGVVLTVDGQWGDPLGADDRVEVFQAPRPLRLYRSGKPYFEILREKLSWGSRAS